MLVNDSVDVKHFCQVYFNIEHLECKNGHSDQLLFLFNCLPKLSIFKFDWWTKKTSERNSRSI